MNSELTEPRRLNNADLGIVIVSWNTREILRNCLRSIFETNGSIDVQVIVVDNASSDGSQDMIRSFSPHVTLIESGGNKGFGKANNMAIPYITAPLILFLNPDTLVQNGTLGKMVSFMKANPKVGALGPKIIDENGKTQELPAQWFLTPLRKTIELFFLSELTLPLMRKLLRYHDKEASGFVYYLYGACLLIKKEVLSEMEAFDERFFMYCEDVDLCHRLVLKGWALYYMSEVKITHLIGGATKGNVSDFGILTMCESISKMMEKYHGRSGKLIYKIALAFSSGLRLVISSIIYLIINKSRKIKYANSMSKYKAALLWCFGIKKI